MASSSVSSSTWSGNLTHLPAFTQGDVETWCTEDCRIPNRTQVKGYEKWLEGFIHEIQVKDCGDKCAVRALSYRSMAKNERPYQVQVCLLKTVSAKMAVQSTACECKAGTGKCSHQIALLYCLAHFQKLGLKAAPPVISKTSQPQQWHLPSRTQGIQPECVHSLTINKVKPPAKHSKKVPKRRRVSEGILPTIYNPLHPAIPWQNIAENIRLSLDNILADRQLLWLLPSTAARVVQTNSFGTVPKGSVLAMQQPHVENGDIIFNDCTLPFPCLVLGKQETYFYCCITKGEQDVLQSLQFDISTCIDIENKTRNQAKTPLWKSVRAKRLTASIFHRIVIRRQNFEKLAQSLLSVKHFQTKAMKHGIEMEDTAAKMYAAVTGRNVYKCGFIINVNSPHIGASPDRKVFDAAAGSVFGLLEIKCPVLNSFSDAQCLKQRSDGTFMLKTNHAYYYQIMGQLGVTGLSWCDLFLMCNNDYHLERIEFRPEVWKDMKTKLDMFFFQYYLPLLAIN